MTPDDALDIILEERSTRIDTDRRLADVATIRLRRRPP